MNAGEVVTGCLGSDFNFFRFLGVLGISFGFEERKVTVLDVYIWFTLSSSNHSILSDSSPRSEP